MKYIIHSLPILAWLLLINNVPYILNSYTYYMDKWNWIFIVFAITSAIITRVVFKKLFKISVNYLYLLMYLIIFGIYGVGIFYDINMIILIAKILVPFVAIATIYGWNTASKFLPTWGFIFLSLPNMNYLVTTYFAINGLYLQMFLGIILAIANGLIIYFPRNISAKKFIFTAGVLVVIIVSIIHKEEAKFDSLIINLSDMNTGNYIIKTKTISDANKKFFVDMNIEEVAIANDDTVINFLKVYNLNDIHKIHPTTHCLRTAKQIILSEKLIKVNINGKEFEFNEIIVQNTNQTKRLIWSWYSNEIFSTANYLYFRKSYSKYDNWSTYQIVTASSNSLDKSREKLKLFLASYLKSITH